MGDTLCNGLTQDRLSALDHTVAVHLAREHVVRDTTPSTCYRKGHRPYQGRNVETRREGREQETGNTVTCPSVPYPGAGNMLIAQVVTNV